MFTIFGIILVRTVSDKQNPTLVVKVITQVTVNSREPERRDGFKQHAHLKKGKRVEREAVCECDRKALEQAAAE
jgi:hypothetical protein